MKRYWALLVTLLSLVPSLALAQNYVPETHPRSVAARTTIGFLALFGGFAIFISLFGAFTWMTAKGDPKTVDKGKKLVYSGGLGLIFVMSLVALTNFVLFQLLQVSV